MRRLLFVFFAVGLFPILSYGQQARVVQAEYFFDADPGAGKGLAMPVTVGDSILINNKISTNGLSGGFHILAFRFRDYKGHWGLNETRTFYVNANTKIATPVTAAEYFIDTDPGQGLATAIAVISGDSVLTSSSLNTKGLNTGFHTLVIRYRNGLGRWGFNEARPFYLSSSGSVSKVGAGEYFIDTDPGVGLGKVLPTAGGDSVLINTVASAAGLKAGFHILVTRFKDAFGHWGLSEARGFYTNNTNPGGVKIAAGEYFFDTDPGAGLGKPLQVSPGDTVSMNALLNSSGLPNGLHTAGLRFRDGNGHWGLTESRPFKICSQLPKADFTYSPNGNPITFTNASVNSLVYSWQFKDGSTDTSTSPVHKFVSPGMYNVCLAARNACTSDTICKNVFIRTCAPGYLPDGFYDNFTGDASPANSDFSGVFPWGEPNLGAPAHPNFQAAISRNLSTKTLDVKLNQGIGEYVPFGITFGDTKGNGTGTPFYLSLTDKTFSVLVTNKSTSQYIKFRMVLVDASNRQIDTYIGAMNDPAGFANAGLYAIEKTVPPGASVLFSDDYSNGVYADNTLKTFRQDFDFTKVKGVNFIVSNAATIGAPSFAHKGLVDVPLSISKVQLGAVSNVRILPVTSPSICSGGSLPLEAAGAKTYAWYPVSGLSAVSITNPVASPAATTTFVVQGSAYGCTSKDSITLTVKPLPTSGFTFTNNTLVNTIDFKVTSSSPKTGYYWDFGDNQNKLAPGPTHTYANPGNYLVSLKVLDSTLVGCQYGTTSYYVPVGAGGCTTKADFSFKKDSLTNLVNFTNGSLNATAWYWDFGNGAFSSSQNTAYTYPALGNYTVCLNARDTVKGCQNSICKAISIGNLAAPCQTKFNYFTDGIGTNVQFDGKSLNSKTSKYFWSFGNGDNSSAANPLYTFNAPGYADVCLYTVDSVTNCQSHYCESIHIGGGDCKAKFLGTPEISSSAVDFQDQSLGSPSAWYWDFGDGIVSSLQNPRHLYATAGYYKVCLTTQNKSGCQNTYCNYVHAGSGNCKTDFAYFVDPVKKSIDFKDLSTGNPVKWFWSFGDGNNSSAQNPSYTYKRDGIYTVCLYSNNANGCINHICQDLTVGQLGIACQARFEGFVSGKTATFKNKSIVGSSNTFYWDFGDQSFSTLEEPVHTYANDGYYTVTFTVYNKDNSCFNTTYKTVIVGNAATLNCQANFSYISNDSTNVVSFKDESLGNAVQWSWMFSDKTTSNLQNPLHKFLAPGFYEVCLTIKSANGTSSIYCTVVGIGQKGLQAAFTYKNDTTYYFKNEAVYPVSFYGAAYGKPTKWKWDFGDKSYDSLRINVVHSYLNTGSYNACLNISDTVAKLSSHACRIVKVGSTLGINENLNTNLNLNLFPNPIVDKGTVTYTLDAPAQTQLNLFDLQGKKIKTFYSQVQQGNIQFSLDISDLSLSQGMYIMNLNANGKSYNRPVIVSK